MDGARSGKGVNRRGDNAKKKLKKPVDTRRFGGTRAGGREESQADRRSGRGLAGGPGRAGSTGREETGARRESGASATQRGVRRKAARPAATGRRTGGGTKESPLGGRVDAEPQEAGRTETALAAARKSRLSPRVVILALLLLLFVGFALGPTLRNLEANSRLKKKEAELKKQRSCTESLESEVEEASSMSYIEEEARKQRMVTPGEVLYIVTSDGDGSGVEYRVKNLQSMDEAWERVRRMFNCAHVAEAEESR